MARQQKSRSYFAEWLTKTLRERGITGGEVARALGVNDSAVSRWKNGKAAPGLDSVMRLADFLGVDPIDLAVTAGLMDEKAVGRAQLPIPEAGGVSAMAEDWIMRIPGITESDRRSLVRTLAERYSN